MSNNNLLEILVYDNGNEYDVSSEVDINSIKIQQRADWAFTRGSMKIITNQITHNIAPYTLCLIRQYDENDSIIEEYGFYISSTVTHNFTAAKYIHDCSFLSLDSILECYILGAKTYTDIGNYDVIDQTIELINYKYNLNIALDDLDSNLNHKITGTSDYTFGTGTTLFEVCKQVAKKVNLKFDIYFNNGNIVIHFFEPTTSNYNLLSSPYVLNVVKSQNPDDYCKYLETEGINVVDRDSEVVWKDLTVRSTYVRADTDHQQLILPTNVEAITKFEVRGYFQVTCDIYLPSVITEAWIEAHGGTQYGGSWTVNMTYQELIETNTPLGNIDNIFQYLYDNGLNRIDVILETICICKVENGLSIFTVNYNNKFNLTDYTHDYSQYIVEEQYFNTLEEANQTSYCMYKSGSNVIDNMNASYRNDLWGLILFQNRNNFLSLNVTNTLFVSGQNYCELIGYAVDSEAIDYRYNVHATPIATCKLIDVKNTNNENETSIKPISRSYQMGDNNGMQTYLDSLIDDMDKQNETLGRVEAVVDLDSTKLVIKVAGETYPSGTQFMPELNQRVNLGGQFYYLTSLEHRFTASRRYTQLNLTKTPYKIADAIGVDYQYNSILIPTQMVIDRTLFREINNSTIYNLIKNNPNSQFFVRFQSIYCNLAKRLSVLEDNDHNYYLYFEALDNYSFDKGISGDVVSDIAYCSRAGYITDVDIYIYQVDSMSVTDANKLPDYSAISGAAVHYALALGWLIFKDTRERLTFTIKIKNPNN